MLASTFKKLALPCPNPHILITYGDREVRSIPHLNHTLTWAVGIHIALHQNARLPFPIRIHGLLVTISMKYAG